MKSLTSLLTIVVLSLAIMMAEARGEDSIFPSAASTDTKKPSLSSALTQFDNVMESSVEGDMACLAASGEYNQERIVQLRQRLADKTRYLADLPDIVGRQFDRLMAEYADADQEQKDKMAEKLHTRWQNAEDRVRTEIAEIEKQLDLAMSRASQAQIDQQILAISTSLVQSEAALAEQDSQADETPSGPSPAYRTLQQVSRQRILSQIRRMCRITVRPLEDNLSISYLDD